MRLRVFIACVLACSVGVKAQETVMSGDALKQQHEVLAAAQVRDWLAFQEQVSREGKTAEARIRMVDEWRLRSVAKERELQSLRGRMARELAAQISPQTQQVIDDSLLADILESDTQIKAALETIKNPAMIAEARIQWIEKFLAFNKQALAEQSERRQVWQQRAVIPEATTATIAQDIRSAQLAVLGQQMRQRMEALKVLSPEERIAAIDAQVKEMNALQKEIARLQREVATATSPSP